MELKNMYPKRNFFDSLDHILNFQVNDLKNSLKKAKANFLVAMGSMNTIEFMGGLLNGELGKQEPGKVKSRFFEGIGLLGNTNCVRNLDRLNNMIDKETWWELRNGLTHQYLPKIKREPIATIIINAGAENVTMAEIDRGKDSIKIRGPYIFVELTELLKAIEQGRKKLVDELKMNEDKRIRAEEALSRLPELL